jgi:hypothetical protein
MDVVFLSPAWPPEMQQFTRGLVDVGARVWGVGDGPPGQLPAETRRQLRGWLQVPSWQDEDDAVGRIVGWCRELGVDRVESNWEVTQIAAARVREALGLPGMSVDTVRGFRDKPLMRERVAAAALRVPRSARVRTRAEAWEHANRIGFPAILKPASGAGSADTFRVAHAGELDDVLERVRHVPELSMEEFIDGEELTYETLCIDGRPVYESVCLYLPRCLVARQNEWISPIILSLRDLSDPALQDGLALGRAALAALGMGTGFTHMEWFKTSKGEVVFGEIACRPPGANMVDLMNYTSDVDLFREWARVVCWRRFEADPTRRYNAAIVFKRARGIGLIRGYEGLDAFVTAHAPHIARIDLLPPGSPRRDWRQTFLSDGNLVVRHADLATVRAIAEEAARSVHVHAGG